MVSNYQLFNVSPTNPKIKAEVIIKLLTSCGCHHHTLQDGVVFLSVILSPINYLFITFSCGAMSSSIISKVFSSEFNKFLMYPEMDYLFLGSILVNDFT